MKLLLLIVLSIAIASLAVFVLNAADGCYPWSPKIVPYHAGMTLCAGQGVVVNMEVKLQ